MIPFFNQKYVQIETATKTIKIIIMRKKRNEKTIKIIIMIKNAIKNDNMVAQVITLNAHRTCFLQILIQTKAA